jgi:type I restriction enzyme R subunit
MSKFTESDVEEAALYYFEQLGYTVLGGPDIAPGEPGAERSSYADVVLGDRLRELLSDEIRIKDAERVVETVA